MPSAASSRDIRPLICSLAYSRIGNLGQSEDIAQETFITAWKHLRHLREPAKLRSWLCGIVRNRIHKNLRREGHEPAHQAEPLDAQFALAVSRARLVPSMGKARQIGNCAAMGKHCMSVFEPCPFW